MMRMGNMTPSGNPATPTVSFNLNNQLAGSPYDQAGNLLSAGGNGLSYDVEGKIATVTEGNSQGVETYVYDGDGRRVMKYRGVNRSPLTVYVYDAEGQMAAEYTTPAASSSPCVTCYLSVDNLGTVRMVTDATATFIARHDYLPFGEEVQANTFGRGPEWGQYADGVSQKFTGKERDDSGLDYFGARYYGSGLGRWTSPDEINLSSGRIVNPSSRLNKYVYAADNPLKFIDSDGLDVTVFYRMGIRALPFTYETGHIYLAALNESRNQVGLIDFGPDQGKAKAATGSVPGLANPARSPENIFEEGYASLTIRTTPEEAQKIIDFASMLQAQNGKLSFNLLSSNCATTCVEALRLLKIDLDPDTINPDTLWDALFQKYGSGNLGTLGHFPAQPGVEYGKPRWPGISTGELAALYYQLYLNQGSTRKEPQACVETSDTGNPKKKTCQ